MNRICLKLFYILIVAWAVHFSALAEQTQEKSLVHSELHDGKLPEISKTAIIGTIPDKLIVVDEKKIQLLSFPSGSLLAEGQLEKSVTAPAIASTSNRLILVGGFVDGSMSNQVISLKIIASRMDISVLPSLPNATAMASAIVMDDTLFVIGGLSSINPSQAAKSLYSLELNNLSKGWIKQSEIPGDARIQSTVGALGSELFVFGGFTGVDGIAMSDGWGFRLKPLDGTTRTGWRNLGKIPQALANSAIYATGQAHFAMLGGLEGDRKLSNSIWIYHTVGNTWIPGGQLPHPIGSGTIMAQKERAYLISPGEIPVKLTITRTSKNLSIPDYGILILYFIVMAGVGLYFASRQKSSENYALGGRDIKWWAAAISMFATGTSAISFMAIPALAFRTNLVWLTPLLFTPVVVVIQAYWLFPLLRKLQLTSTFEYLERRFHPSLRFLASIQCIIFHTVGRMSIVLLLPSLAISAVTGISVGTSVIIMGVIATFYTATGGFEAVIWTDVIQGGLMLVGVILMIIIPINGLPGGWSEFVETGKEFNRFDMAIWSLDCSKPVLWMYFLAVLVQGLSVVSDQTTVQRVFSTPLKDVRRLAGMSMACGVVVAVLITMAGISIFAWFRAHPTMLDPSMHNDQVVPLFVVQGVPSGIAGLIIAGIFAASLSTLAGSMNSVATLVGEDFYRRINNKATDRKRLLVMKISSALTGVFGTTLAFIMAKMPIDSIFQIWNEIIALLGGGFVGIYILGMFTQKTSSTGAIIGAVGSIICTILIKNYSSLHWIFYTPFAVISCLVLGYASSLVMPSQRVKDLNGLTVHNPEINISKISVK